MQVWYPSTVATLSREIKKTVKRYFDLTSDTPSHAGIEFVLNDFGFRGVSSVESAGLGGSAHLINFRASDTVYASVFARNYYNAQKTYGMSIPATEHSIMTLLGKEGERNVFEHVLNAYPEGLVACVSDSYDIFNAVANTWGTELKDKVLQRNGTLVIRPDSGDPVKTLLKVFELLFSKFEFTVNSKGYKVLPPQVRVIQGDGVDYDSIVTIYQALAEQKISAENLVLGMGGALLQKVNRDTQKYALKCSYAEVNGTGREVMKSPLEMDHTGTIVKSFKASKAGKLKLVRTNEGMKTVGEHEPGIDILETVFKNGMLTRDDTFEMIRERAKI